jgi:hypothetical protein
MLAVAVGPPVTVITEPGAVVGVDRPGTEVAAPAALRPPPVPVDAGVAAVAVNSPTARGLARGPARVAIRTGKVEPLLRRGNPVAMP